MLHRLCGSPSIPLSFNLAIVLPRRLASRVSFPRHSTPASSGMKIIGTSIKRISCHHNFSRSEKTKVDRRGSEDRLQRGLHGYLIRFAPHAFVSQRQNAPRKLPSPLVFPTISKDFTPPPSVPLSPSHLKPSSIRDSSKVRPWNLTTDWLSRLQTLYAQ